MPGALHGQLPDLDGGEHLCSCPHFAPILDLNKDIDFRENQRWLESCQSLLDQEPEFRDIADIFGDVPDGLVNYVGALQPVHRVKPHVLKAILRDGGLRSRAAQDRLRDRTPVEAATFKFEKHPHLGALLRKWGLKKGYERMFAEAMLPVFESELRWWEMSDKERDKTNTQVDELRDRLNLQFGENEIGQARVDKLMQLARTVLESVQNTESTGIGCPADVVLGTNKHVFSVVGTNVIQNYGKIILLLKPSIMQHPDFNMTMTAATSYHSLRTYFHRPWAALGKVVNYDPNISELLRSGQVSEEEFNEMQEAVRVMRDGEEFSLSEEDRVMYFHQSKLHPSIVGWDRILAMELALQCRLFFMSKRDPDNWIDKWTLAFRQIWFSQYPSGYMPRAEDISLEVVKEWYTLINSHGCIEGHLPDFVPLEYVESIIMPKSVHDEMHAVLQNHLLADGSSLLTLVKAIDVPEDEYFQASWRIQCEHFERRSRMPSPFGELYNRCSFSFGIEGLRGEELFLPVKVQDPRHGLSLRFAAQGQHIRISMTNSREQTRNVNVPPFNVDMYFVAIGAFKNTCTFVKESNFSGSPVRAKVTRGENPSAMAWPDCVREWWIQYNRQKGLILIGHDSITPANTILSWIDPCPKDVCYVAVSCWTTPIHFQSFRCS